jgi:hypothetical protein
MASLPDSGLLHQKIILDAILELKTELEKRRTEINLPNKNDDSSKNLSGMFDRLLELAELIESESSYFFELSNCRQLMLKDNLEYIKTLERELRELKP